MKISHEINNFFLHDIEIYNCLWYLFQAFNMTPLILSVWKNHIDAVKLLLEQKNIEINCKDV